MTISTTITLPILISPETLTRLSLHLLYFWFVTQTQCLSLTVEFQLFFVEISAKNETEFYKLIRWLKEPFRLFNKKVIFFPSS